MTDQRHPGDRPEEYDDEDIPEADPAIRKDYEAALGRLILAHNDVDLHLTRLIQCCLAKLLEPPELARMKHGMFAQRLDHLRMLNAISSDLKLRGVDFGELADLNAQRNIVAHGHFEQNPYMGDYALITNKQTYKDFSIKRLDGITERLDRQADALKPLVWFYDTIVVPPEDAEPAIRIAPA